MYYFGKVKFETVNDNNGKVQITKEQYLIEAESVIQASEKLNKEFKDTMADLSIEEVKESRIMGIIK